MPFLPFHSADVAALRVAALVREISAIVSFQEFRHSVGMTDSSPAIYRRVSGRERERFGGTLDCPCTDEFHPSRWDGQIPFGDYPAINRRPTFKCPSGTTIPLLIGLLQRSPRAWPLGRPGQLANSALKAIGHPELVEGSVQPAIFKATELILRQAQDDGILKVRLCRDHTLSVLPNARYRFHRLTVATTTD